MRAKGLMKDDFHYYQAAYNQVGTAAGAAAARFVQNDTAYGIIQASSTPEHGFAIDKANFRNIQI